ncbi:MerR family transcriptional regulator [Alkalihalobacterium bogoriense]|uniref:MerR family transcriptional regulator n=1 Tax=Alkalihalobacterium bogoriense TaxID=246272 RepID=UPI00047D045B|nr:helix-turn-helix domain-containing protein [Alkalihalobacterium bogoriense]
MDNKRYFSIGEVSKFKNVTIKALRYYHNIGLLVPAYINPDNGYRYYTIEQFIYLDIIKVCKQSNVSIKEIKDLFAKADTNYLKLYLEQKNEEIHKKIKELEQLTKRIKTLKNAIQTTEDELKQTGFTFRTLDERYFFRSPAIGGELNEIMAFEKLDEKLGEDVSQTFQYGLIYSHQTNQWQVSDVFRVITSNAYSLFKENTNVFVLQKGEYVTINCTRDTELETFQLILEYLEKNQLTCDKIYLFYLVTEIFNQDNHFSQYQFRLKPTP